jgi:hypothetical protein
MPVQAVLTVVIRTASGGATVADILIIAATLAGFVAFVAVSAAAAPLPTVKRTAGHLPFARRSRRSPRTAARASTMSLVTSAGHIAAQAGASQLAETTHIVFQPWRHLLHRWWSAVGTRTDTQSSQYYRSGWATTGEGMAGIRPTNPAYLFGVPRQI